MPVQRVCRPNHEFRGFQGQIESGKLAVGESIVTLPSNETATVKSILVGDKDVSEAVAGQAVTIQLDKEVDVSRGCVLTNQADLPVAKNATATFLWMDDEPLTLGKEYLVKLGTKKIAGQVKSIEYKIDVNTGEHLPADSIEKNEIAVCKVEFTEKIVVDEFKKNKTLGELILIDRVSHMTSACGVVDAVDESDEKPYFEKEELKTGGYIFEEFYFNLDNAFLSKAYAGDKTYHVGDAVPVEGDSFKYPDYFDIIAVDDGVAILIRNRAVFDIISLKDYQYMGLPVLDERGFALRIQSAADLERFLLEHKNVDKDNRLNFHNKWSKFETYRRIVCTDNFWMI
jgi:sulfate adenylyltransferase subunit 1